MSWSAERRQAKRPAVLIVALLLCSMAGCYEHEISGNQSIYRFVWWLGPVVFVVGVLGSFVGWRLRKYRWGFIGFIMGPVLILIVAPSMFSDRVVIDDDHFEARYGFWFSPTVHHVRFDELREMRYVAVTDMRGRRKFQIHCVMNSGEVEVVHSGDLVKNTVSEFLARAQARGVPVVNRAH